MKSAKKILALILAGVMALALLTGCGKATSLNRTVAEGLAEHTKLALAEAGNNHNISVSYQVPELRRDIAPLFDENWITKDSSGKDALTEAAKKTLTDILSSYMSDSYVSFLATDVTDVKNPVLEVLNLNYSDIAFRSTISDPSQLAPITSMKIEVTHKTVNGRTYALAVMIGK
jgi:hypothetical protein